MDIEEKIVKYESKIFTNTLNNKDLLIVSLVEYICNMHDNSNDLFFSIIEFLKTNNIVIDDKIDEINEDFADLKYLCIKMIDNLFSHKKIRNSSRYSFDFIEMENIGYGGFGNVYKVYNKIDEKLYAIKKININELDKNKSNYYLNEVRYLSKFNHSNIIRYYASWIELENNELENNRICDDNSNQEEHRLINEEYFDESKTPIMLYIQMELCQMTLETYINKRNYNNEEINFSFSISIFKSIVGAICEIHQNNIIHCDINPKNIFLDDKMNVKVGDFGLSKHYIENNELLIDNGYYGNILYLSPEQEKKLCNNKSDIYSLGIVFLELMISFNTSSERIEVINNVKSGIYTNIKLDNKYIALLKKMLVENHKERVDISFVKEYICNF